MLMRLRARNRHLALLPPHGLETPGSLTSRLMRDLLRPLVPPIAARFRHPRCKTWEEARARAGLGYSDPAVSEFRVERALANNRAYDPTNNLLYLTARQFDQPLEITDFGGATGELGEAVSAAIPNVTYTVIEHPSLVEIVRSKLRGNVLFETVIPVRCDIFYTGGTLQVIDAPYDLVETAFQSARKAVVLVRNCFSDKEIIRVLKSRLYDNGSGAIPEGYQNRVVRYPHRTIDERRIFQSAERHGFSCVAKIREMDGVLAYDETVYGRQLVFVRL